MSDLRDQQLVPGRNIVKRKVVLTTLFVGWLLTVGLGLKMVWNYAAQAGEAAAPPAHWPSGSVLQPASDRATLVLLAHPRCPCTRATVGELAVLMAKCQGKLTAYVSFYQPAGDDWERTNLWNSASEIPGVSVLRDEDGSVAASFNAATSGQVLLYDSRGDLLFAGGITSARGHSGDNSGREAIISILNNQTEEHQGTPVFGCPIFDPHSQCNEGTHQ
jgi:hypothetical protein